MAEPHAITTPEFEDSLVAKYIERLAAQIIAETSWMTVNAQAQIIYGVLDRLAGLVEQAAAGSSEKPVPDSSGALTRNGVEREAGREPTEASLPIGGGPPEEEGGGPALEIESATGFR